MYCQLKERKKKNNEGGATLTVGITRGVLQGSALGLLLWNVAYDTVLHLQLPRRTITIGYSDDMLIVVEGNKVETVQNLTYFSFFCNQQYTLHLELP